jgi:O-antigen/teichoic acid export membrane protein
MRASPKKNRTAGLLRSEFMKNVATLVTGTGFAQLIAIAIYPALTRLYTPGDFGLFALYMSIVSITAIMAGGRYELAIMIPKEEEVAVGLFRLSVRINLMFSLFLMVLVLAFNRPFSRFLGDEAIGPWLYLVPLSTLLVGLFHSMKFRQNRHKGYRSITLANIGQSFTNSGVKLAMGPLVAGPAGLMAGTVLGQLAGFLVFWKRRKGAIPKTQNPDTPDPEGKSSVRSVLKEPISLRALAREYSMFPKFNMLRGVISILSGALPVFIFTQYFSAAVAGLYSLGYTVIYRPMGLVISAFFQVLFQNLIEKHNQGRKILPDIRKFLGRLALVVLPAFLLFLLFSPAIFSFVFGPEWREAGRYAQVMIPWLFVVLLSMPLSFIPDIFKRQQTATLIDVVKLLSRIAALVAGVYYNDAYLALALFSLVSTLVIGYNLLWYLNLVRNSDREKKN